MHVWTLLQHTMIVIYILRRTVHKAGYVTPVLLSSVVFVNKVLTLFTCDNGSEQRTGMNTHVTPSVNFLEPRYYGLSLLRTPNRDPEGVRYNGS